MLAPPPYALRALGRLTQNELSFFGLPFRIKLTAVVHTALGLCGFLASLLQVSFLFDPQVEIYLNPAITKRTLD